tara:strand:- start:1955 stop:2326 length:372 start_codon:yes stop_codon:yes gene_type:complete
MSAETPEEFWYENLSKYHSVEALNAFPQNVTVTSLVKMTKTDVVILKGYLKNGQNLVITYPAHNNMVKNFIGIGIGDCEYDADTSVQVYELDYNLPMTDEFVQDLLVNSHAWEILEYGDLSVY